MSQTTRRGVFQYSDGALTPVGDHAHSLLAGIRQGERVMISIRRARWPEHHRLAFAVFQRLAEASGFTVNAILLWLKWQTGYCDWLRLPNGRVVPNPRSISFESMDQSEFQAWWDEALEHIKETMFKRLTAREFREIQQIVARKDDRDDASKRRDTVADDRAQPEIRAARQDDTRGDGVLGGNGAAR